MALSVAGSSPLILAPEGAGLAATSLPAQILVTDVVAAPTALTGNTAPQKALVREEFLSKITRHTSRILPVPSSSKQRVTAGHSAPRRSRQVAGAEVEFKMQDLEKRSTKKAMRALNIIGEIEGINQ